LSVFVLVITGIRAYLPSPSSG